MDSTEIMICFFFFQNYLLFNYIITKIVDRKIEYQLNNEIFLDNDNLIENKMKQMVKKKNSQLTQYIRIKLK
jgi:hypothetical protein